MSPLELLRAALVADGDVNALVSGRVYPDLLPIGRNDPVMPAIVLTLIDENEPLTHARDRGLCFTLVQVDSWAETPASRLELVNAVRALLNGYSGKVMAGSPSTASGDIQGAFLVRSRNIPDNDAKLYRNQADYEVWSQEA